MIWGQGRLTLPYQRNMYTGSFHELPCDSSLGTAPEDAEALGTIAVVLPRLVPTAA